MIEIKTVSNNVNQDRIVYDHNMAFDYLVIHTPTVPNTTLIKQHTKNPEIFNSNIKKTITITPGQIPNLDIIDGIVIVI